MSEYIVKAAERLQREGFDVAVRLSPYIPEWVDTERFNQIAVDKCVVEFLRVNGFIRKWITGVDLDSYTVKHARYRHLPLERKVELLKSIKFKEVTVCDDVPEHWEWFRSNYNPNPDDCCNLRRRG